MPTTRAATRAAKSGVEETKQTLVRFDSTLVELTPTAALPIASTKTVRVSKRKITSSDVENSVEQGKGDSEVPPPKRKRTVASSASLRGRFTKNKGNATPTSTTAPLTNGGILKPATVEVGQGPMENLYVPAVPSPDDATVPPDAPPELVPAVLTFDFEAAKRHLIKTDSRFGDLFARMKCRPYENLEPVDPFRTLVTSILGQQIAWTAARAIYYRFLRLYNPQLPEERPTTDDWERNQSVFPSPSRVASTPLATLKGVGLSTRKAEYIVDLSQHFASGRISTHALTAADDEELAQMLISVRGIGRWTVDMFAMFSLRRPDILPVGDLGVQQGLLRWALSRHSPAHPFSIHPEKLPKTKNDDEAAEKDDRAPHSKHGDGSAKDAREKDDTADPTPEQDDAVDPAAELAARVRPGSPDVSSVPPAPALATPARGGRRQSARTPAALGLPSLPTPFTASIERTLAGETQGGGDDNDVLPSASESVPKLPKGLSVAVLKARLEGKKKIKGALLTPEEMEALTEEWRPYRSLGVYYMWALADAGAKTKK